MVVTLCQLYSHLIVLHCLFSANSASAFSGTLSWDGAQLFVSLRELKCPDCLGDNVSLFHVGDLKICV